jgi:superfamily II DNA or RNA helicase
MAKKRIEKKRRREEADSDDEQEKLKSNQKKSKTKQIPQTNISQIPKRNPQIWSTAFQKNFWSGASVATTADAAGAGSLAVSEELKLQRKSLGILVKGALSLCPAPVTSFDHPSYPDSFKKILSKANITLPTPIQMQCLPAILNGCNVLGISPTGSGKTFGYLLPMLPHVHHQMMRRQQASSGPSSGPSLASPIALIIVPTRELALQVVASCKLFKTIYQMRSLAIYGGLEKKTQVEKLSDHPTTEIIVATPGRLLDLLSSSDLVLDRVTYLVIDEADRMLALGFEEQLNAINECIRPDRQTILFTATFPGKLRESSTKWMGEVVTTLSEDGSGTSVSRGRAEAEYEQTVIVRVNTMEFQGTQTVSKQQPQVTDSRKLIDDEQRQPPSEVQTPSEELTNPLPSSEETVPTTEDLSSPSPPSSSGGTGTMTMSLTLNPAIVQHVHVCASHKKPRLLLSYLTRIRQAEKDSRVRQPEPMMIFCSKIKTINFLMKLLTKNELSGVNLLHGQLTQQNREAILKDFKAVWEPHFWSLNSYLSFLCPLLRANSIRSSRLICQRVVSTSRE